MLHILPSKKKNVILFQLEKNIVHLVKHFIITEFGCHLKRSTKMILLILKKKMSKMFKSFIYDVNEINLQVFKIKENSGISFFTK